MAYLGINDVMYSVAKPEDCSKLEVLMANFFGVFEISSDKGIKVTGTHLEGGLSTPEVDIFSQEGVYMSVETRKGFSVGVYAGDNGRRLQLKTDAARYTVYFSANNK